MASKTAFDKALGQLVENNRQWAASMIEADPDFFSNLVSQQAPEYLWIGCSDSRVPANSIVGLDPGELFVHRNVANVVVHTDLNSLSVLQFAIDLLGVKHVMVVGHYGCSGVQCAMEGKRVGLADNWLRHVQDVFHKHEALLPTSMDDQARHNRLCELNVIEQVVNVCQTTAVQDAWARGQPLKVHALIYGLHDGVVRRLGLHVGSPDDLAQQYPAALAALSAQGELT